MTLGLIAKLLMTGQLKFEGGKISLKDITMTLLPSFFSAELTKYFDKEQKIPRFYMLSWFWGFVLVRQVSDRFNLQKPDQVYTLGMDLAEAMGIGLYNTHDYYLGRFTHFEIESPFVKYWDYPKEKGPMDIFIAGAMAGGGCVVHKEVCQNVELKCMVQGNPKCEFLTGTEKELRDRKLWDVAEQRYDLKTIYPMQKEIYEGYDEKKLPAILDKIMTELK